MIKNMQIVNMRRQIQHDIEKFWCEDDGEEDIKK